MNTPELEKLITQCLKGNERAKFSIYHTYVKGMYNVAYRIMGNQFDAEDVIQEAFIKAFSKLNTYKGKSTLGAWIKGIVVNESLSQIRKQKTITIPIVEDLNTDAEQVNDLDIDEAVPIKEVMTAINNLPDGARIVFTLKAIEEYKFKEIAQLLKLSESNCKVQYHRAKKVLREKLANKVMHIE